MMKENTSKVSDGSKPNISRVIIENFIERLRHIPMRSEMFRSIIALIKLSIESAGETITADKLYLTYEEDFESEEIYEDFEEIYE